MKTIKKVELFIHFTDEEVEHHVGTFEETQDFMEGAESAHYTSVEEEYDNEGSPTDQEAEDWWDALDEVVQDELMEKYHGTERLKPYLDMYEIVEMYQKETGISAPSSIALQGVYKNKMDVDTRESQWTGGPSTGTSKHGPQI